MANVNLIKRARICSGLKQEDLARVLGLQRANYAAVENGALRPKNLAELEAKALRYMKPTLEQKITEITELLAKVPEVC